MTTPHRADTPAELTLVAVSAGTSEPSSTRMLADRLTDRTLTLSAARDLRVAGRVIELRPLANDIAKAVVSNHVSPTLQQALDLMRDADGIIASTPVYKAGPSGLFTQFFQLLDNDLLIGTPVVLAGTGGSERHALVIDDQLRGLFAYLRTLTAPTAVYATPDDWQHAGLGARVDRAATELMLLLRAGLRAQLRDSAWNSYQHRFDSAATPGSADPSEIDFDTELMRLAAGGS